MKTASTPTRTAPSGLRRSTPTYCVLALLFVLLLPGRAEAYLDPASGNALVSFLIAILGSAVYFCKSIFYKLFFKPSSPDRAASPQDGETGTPLILSEGKTYWTTFRPVVEELIRRKIRFRYVSLDIHDPALAIDSEYMDSRRYPGNAWGFSRIARLRGPMMLSTTPNIGCEGYPMKRPEGILKLVHVFHSLLDVSCYHKGSMDHYDAVLLAGPQQEAPVRLVEEARGLRPKELVEAGLPYLDDLRRQMEESGVPRRETGAGTVLVAPSWGPKGCFSQYGTDFSIRLAEAGYRVIIRLHPQSWIYEPEAVERWKRETEGYENIAWDRNTFGTEAMGRADILISDTSSIRFDFAFLYMKPVITLVMPQEKLSIYESDYMERTWADTVAGELGPVLSAEGVERIASVVPEALTAFTEERIKALRDKYLSNYGTSASAIVDYMVKECAPSSTSPLEAELRREIERLRREVAELKSRLEGGDGPARAGARG
jgi:hypothetical protein